MQPRPVFPSRGRRGLCDVTIRLGGSRQGELRTFSPETMTTASLRADCGPDPIVLDLPSGEVTLRSEAAFALISHVLQALAE